MGREREREREKRDRTAWFKVKIEEHKVIVGPSVRRSSVASTRGALPASTSTEVRRRRVKVQIDEVVGSFSIHETDKEKEILRSGYIGGMSHYGGVNFSVNQPGGYRKKATALITIEPQNLALAIASG